jgi:hypothetical protein
MGALERALGNLEHDRETLPVEPYVHTDGTKVWSLMLLERQLRPEAYRRRRGGYLDRRRGPTVDPVAR